MHPKKITTEMSLAYRDLLDRTCRILKKSWVEVGGLAVLALKTTEHFGLLPKILC